MKIEFSYDDRKKFEALCDIMRQNAFTVSLFGDYLNLHQDFITKELIDSVAVGSVGESEAFCAILAELYGVGGASDAFGKRIYRSYILPSVKKLDPEIYRNDGYYMNIVLPSVKRGGWELGRGIYKPYEAFVRGDIVRCGDFREIPQIGFFGESFTYPEVRENGREWMTVTPNEVETMRKPISDASGSVVTFGLGLGYFAYHASEKESVTDLTVVERDENVISLFKEFILPHFKNPEKITVIQADAFEYAEKFMPERAFNYAFTDLWHDVSDGTDMYIKMKKLEKFCEGTRFAYWIEGSILSHLRGMVFSELTDASEDGRVSIGSYNQLVGMLSDGALSDIAGMLKPYKES